MSRHRPQALLYQDDGFLSVRVYRVRDVTDGDTIDLSADYTGIVNVTGMATETNGGNGFKFVPTPNTIPAFPPILLVKGINLPRAVVYLLVSGQLA